MQFQLAGLASGFDWRSMIDQLMAAERIPQQRLRADQGKNKDTRDTLELLETKMDSLKSTVGGLRGVICITRKRPPLRMRI